MESKDILKEIRKETKMTQKEFAMYFQIPKRTLEDWERGARKMPDYLLRLMLYKLYAEKRITKHYEISSSQSEQHDRS